MSASTAGPTGRTASASRSRSGVFRGRLVKAFSPCVACAIARTGWLRFAAGGLILLAAGSRGIAVLVTAAVTPEISFLPALGWTLVFVLQAVAWPVLAPPRRR